MPSLSLYKLLVHSTLKQSGDASDLAVVVGLVPREPSHLTEPLHYG